MIGSLLDLTPPQRDLLVRLVMLENEAFEKGLKEVSTRNDILAGGIPSGLTLGSLSGLLDGELNSARALERRGLICLDRDYHFNMNDDNEYLAASTERGRKLIEDSFKAYHKVMDILRADRQRIEAAERARKNRRRAERDERRIAKEAQECLTPMK